MDVEDGSRTKNIVFAAATICHEEIRASGEMLTRTPLITNSGTLTPQSGDGFAWTGVDYYLANLASGKPRRRREKRRWKFGDGVGEFASCQV
jgi:hypothetical protein